MWRSSTTERKWLSPCNSSFPYENAAVVVSASHNVCCRVVYKNVLLWQWWVNALLKSDVPVGHLRAAKTRYESPFVIPNFTRQAWLFRDSNYLHCSFRSVSGTNALSEKKFPLSPPLLCTDCRVAEACLLYGPFIYWFIFSRKSAR